MRVKPSHCKPVVANVPSAFTATNPGAAIYKIITNTCLNPKKISLTCNMAKLAVLNKNS
jgi:hypothetical protein